MSLERRIRQTAHVGARRLTGTSQARSNKGKVSSPQNAEPPLQTLAIHFTVICVLHHKLKMRIIFITWLFSITILTILCIRTILVYSQCLEDQKSLLLQLKNSLKFNPPISIMLVNWTPSNDCCGWKGVTCDQAGHVTGLDLNSDSISSGVNQSSSLFRLQFLECLNLVNNSFIFKQIPSSFVSLTSLKYLNLSNAGFSGQIPIELSLMTSHCNFRTQIYQSFFRILLGIQNCLDGGSEWGQAISSSLPNLRVLSLSNCNFSGPIDSSLLKLQSFSKIHLGSNNYSAPVPDFFANFRNLIVLSLSSSNLKRQFLEKIFLIPTLQTLDLTNNGLLNGSLPEVGQIGSLQRLVLSNTNFSGKLPDSIGNLRNLSRVDLSFCDFSGPIPNSILNHLVYLDLSSNNFSGPIPSFYMSKNITYIDLSHNALLGPVPSSYFEGLLDLVYIDSAYNSFNGRVPSSLFSLPYLQKLLLSNNQFGGQVALFPNGSLSPLDTLDLISISSHFLSTTSVAPYNLNGFKGCKILQDLTFRTTTCQSVQVSNSSMTSFPQLSTLRLASCKLQEFPPLMNWSRMVYLDLSDNQISGEILNWNWNVGNGTLMFQGECGENHNNSWPKLQIIDLALNNFSGWIQCDAIYIGEFHY
ncbi:hypothetical protein HYC85_006442 [Camellia sinensis]|uniref:Leucine-rich repeat-containing N-terminal plant-type domain-containing protein n=1 Tax=Camellia sinensis TaxID=4442 RepID=A0A7J7HNN0_CAMSI|nr:hypothetical protein HYC85_006442 [Camellia sinensis]